jgi:hypothetical protein
VARAGPHLCGEGPVPRFCGQALAGGARHLPGLPRRNPRPRARPAAPSAPAALSAAQALPRLPGRAGGGADERAPVPPFVFGATLTRGTNAEAERRTLGAPGGGALAEAARRIGMSEAEVLDLALARSAWKSMVAVRLGAGHACLRWSKTPLPALENLCELSHADAFGAADRARIFLDD